MIGISGGRRVLLATQPIDFRKGMDTLAALVAEVLKADPFICARQENVAARDKIPSFCGVTGLCRHIIIKGFPATAVLDPWVGTGPAVCLRYLPYPVRGASSRHRQ